MGTIRMIVVSIMLAFSSMIALLSSRLALALDQSAIRLFPHERSLVCLHQGRLFARIGALTEAFKTLSAGRADAPEPIVFDLEIASVLERSGDLNGALACYENILTTADVAPDFIDRVRAEIRRVSLLIPQ